MINSDADTRRQELTGILQLMVEQRWSDVIEEQRGILSAAMAGLSSAEFTELLTAAKELADQHHRFKTGSCEK